MSCTVRFRFRVSTPLASDETRLRLELGGREALISADGDRPLRESNWLILNIHGLENKELAEKFGRRVAHAVMLAGARLGVGIDAGDDKASSGFGQVIVDAMAGHGHKLMPNVHGLLVYEREGTERFVQINATGTITINPALVFSEIALSFDGAVGVGVREQTALSLISLSKIAREPLAEAVLCISAVEFLSSDISPWTDAQLELLNALRVHVLASTDRSNDEAKQVADALEHLRRKTVRQSIKRKMTALGFSPAEWKTFEEVYKLRSGIFHGTITARERYAELAERAREICTRIVLSAVAFTES